MLILDERARARLVRQAVLEKLDRFAAVLGDAALASVRVTVNLRPDGVPRSVVVEPQFRVEST